VVIRLRNVGLTIDIRKYKFEIKKTKYLGLIISDKGVRIDLNKVVAVIN
jgi:hypothetical protein